MPVTYQSLGAKVVKEHASALVRMAGQVVRAAEAGGLQEGEATFAGNGGEGSGESLAKILDLLLNVSLGISMYAKVIIIIKCLLYTVYDM